MLTLADGLVVDGDLTAAIFKHWVCPMSWEKFINGRGRRLDAESNQAFIPDQSQG